MPIFYDNLGFKEIINDEKVAGGIFARAFLEGKPVMGYYGCPYMNDHYGDAQFIVRTRVHKDENSIEAVGLDTHADSNSIWKVRLSEISLSDPTDDFLSRRCAVTRENGEGMTIINIVNADILPSFAPDEIYSLQMIAFPVHIQYFTSQEEYENSVGPENDIGSKTLLGEGSVLPIGFLSNHMVDRNGKRINDKTEDTKLDDYVAVKGTVKKLYHGILKFGNEEYSAFIRCIIDTEYGELEIDHVIEDVDEAERSNIRVGAVVCATCVLSADAAIGEYADGFVRNEENSLRLMRYTWMGGDPERLRCALRENCVYKADSSGKTYEGIDAIINKIKTVQTASKHKYITHYATIQAVEKTPADYKVGTRCIVLASDEPDNYESIGFISVDEKGYITHIHTSRDSRYHFKIDELPKKDLIEDVILPESYRDSMVMRARYHGFFGNVDEDPYEIRDRAYNDISEHYDLVNAIWDMVPEDIEIPGWDEVESVFGYLFAKGMEGAYTGMPEELSQDGWNEEYATTLEGDSFKKIQYAYMYGKQFYTDFVNFRIGKDNSFWEELKEASAFVYSLGRQCADLFMSGN